MHQDKENTIFPNVPKVQATNSFLYEVETSKDTKITKNNVSFHSIQHKYQVVDMHNCCGDDH